MHKLIPLLLLLLPAPGLQSQQLSPSVISAGGSFFSNQYGMLSATIGELAAVETYGNQYLILTQGFQQPWEIITSTSGDKDVTLELAIYPNPSNGSFKILVKGDSQSTFDYKILDVTGHEISQGKIIHEGSITIHPIDILPPQGVYFLTFQSGINAKQYFQKINIIH